MIDLLKKNNSAPFVANNFATQFRTLNYKN